MNNAAIFYEKNIYNPIQNKETKLFNPNPCDISSHSHFFQCKLYIIPQVQLDSFLPLPLSSVMQVRSINIKKKKNQC